jgi:hypothetical protein
MHFAAKRATDDAFAVWFARERRPLVNCRTFRATAAVVQESGLAVQASIDGQVM